ncbi:MAG: sigma-70 family RNA polymerase sigma factor [Clostridiales Family XIII bacterium]|jgi:RNA polymerase sigma factor (sigma-70 family)|nr:sigma-70 family RNA polymerase sigma factor [Clostridiales Family XIII bacterium]
MAMTENAGNTGRGAIFDENERDRQKFERIYDMYGKLLLSIAWQVLGNDEACDAYQRCLIRIYRNIGKIGEASDLRTRGYVCKIMKNEAIRSYRAAAALRGNEISLEAMTHDEADRAGVHAPEQLLSEEIAHCFSKLSHEDRRILALRHISGYSNADLEKILNLPGATVRQRISRARKRLGAIMTEEGIAP